ncbi:hypothetical protein [Lacunimicrobium album]
MRTSSEDFVEVNEWQTAIGIEHTPGSRTNHVMLVLVGILLVNVGYFMAFHDVNTFLKMFH